MTTGLVSIQTSGDDIKIVNQLLLPHVVEFLSINNIEEAHDAIKTMKVRWYQTNVTIRLEMTKCFHHSDTRSARYRLTSCSLAVFSPIARTQGISGA